jgi:hypothetical protein
MGMANIKSELWASDIIALLEDSLIGAAVGNRNIVKTDQGDTMHIVGAGEVTTSDYVQGVAITYSDPTDTDTSFTYNIDKNFAIIAHDKDVKQAAVAWQGLYASRGAHKLKDAIDESIFADHASWGLNNFETGSTDWQVGADGGQMNRLFASVAAQLDTANAAQQGRYMVLPSIGIQALRLHLGAKATELGDQVSNSGLVGRFLGFDVFHSNNLTTVSTTVHGMAGVTGDGFAYGQQIDPDDIEAMRDVDQFATYIRGRALAGHKVYRAGILVDINLNTNLLA